MVRVRKKIELEVKKRRRMVRVRERIELANGSQVMVRVRKKIELN